MNQNPKIKIFLALVPMLLGVLIMYVLTNQQFTKIPIEKTTTIAQPVRNPLALSDIKRKYFYFSKSLGEKPSISAGAYVVGDLKTGEIILSKNQDKKHPIASITKVMTAIVTSEIGKNTDIAVVSKNALATLGSNGNLRMNEKIKVSDLVYPLLLESSNDASEVVAEHYNREKFIEKMNTEAKRIQMNSTFFKDPSGLSFDNQSTAYDLFKMIGYVYQKKPEILNISTKRNYTNKTHSWFNINSLIHKPEYKGGKTGFTVPAKETIISVFSLDLGENGERPIGITLLQSNDRERDIENILKYLKKHIYYSGEANATRNWITESLALPDIREPDFITFAFLGDMMLDRGVKSSVNKNFAGDYSSLFEKMNGFNDAEIVFANLEGTASDKGKDLGNLYSFRMDPVIVPAMKGAGINILSVANNHVGDWDRESYIDTLNRLKENEILYTGGGTLAEATEPTVIEKYGMKIGFLGLSDVGPNWMKATEEKVGLLLANDPNIEEIIKQASEKVDYLIVSFHWGEEYKTKNNTRQQNLARLAIDNGAKIVIGHHPHVVQNTEVYKNGFIAYSLGNFIFDQKFSTATMEGMMLELKLGRAGDIAIKKHIVKLNSFFQPDKIILGKEEKIKFQNEIKEKNR